MIERCIVCRSRNLDPLLEIKSMPVFCNVLSPTPTDALKIPRGDIKLASCQECGHIFNLEFNTGLMDYRLEYENSLHYSERFNQFASVITCDLIERYDLTEATILDIGCGNGEFLELICGMGNNHGVGFDPRHIPGNGKIFHQRRQGNIRIIQDTFSDKYHKIKADFILCRHVLEHLNDPAELLARIHRALKNKQGGGAYFEVPNMDYTIDHLAIWDILYEHCSYFSGASLSRLVSSCGFEPRKLNLGFGNQFICLDVSSERIKNENLKVHRRMIDIQPRQLKAFAQEYCHKVELWHQKMEALLVRDSRIVLWGAGSKGVTFLNAVALEGGIQYVVDINPRKQGNFISGTGQQIVAPEFLQEYRPDAVILMNPIYKKEIVELTRRLGVYTDILVA